MIIKINENKTGYEVKNIDFVVIDETCIPKNMKVTAHFIIKDVSDVVYETACIKLPTSDTKGSYGKMKNKLDDIEHVNIWVPYQIWDNFDNKHSYGWIWVELKKPIDGIKMIPFMIHKGGPGLSINPDFHKYFLRGFTQPERHHIIGYLYKYGSSLLMDANSFYKKHGREIEDDDMAQDVRQMWAFYFKDSDVPKRIDMGPKKGLKGTTFQYVIDDYDKWMKFNKNR